MPTLDTSLRVNEKNIVEYRYYEKPTTTNTTIKLSSTMSENPKVQCLSNNLVRRLLNTQEQLPNNLRAEVEDRYGVKLMSNGFIREQTRKILVNRIKGYMSKKERRSKSGIGGGRLHRTAEESSKVRMMKKLLSKSSWFRSSREEGEELQRSSEGGPGS